MDFLWPQALWLLAAVPLLVALYVVALRRRARRALRYTSLALIHGALTPGQRLRRHVPPLLLLVALTTLAVAVARPLATVTLPSDQRTIVLAIDVSKSMRATDVSPSRIGAAREAAKAFIRDQPGDVRIAIVSFAGSAAVVQKPTHDRADLEAALDRLELQIHTSIGSGIIMSLATLFPDQGLEAEDRPFPSRPAWEGAQATPVERAKGGTKKEWKPVAPGTYRHGAIILLTDGRRTIGPDPLAAAKLAADRGVKVYTVGFGRTDASPTDIDGYSIYMRFDEETLKAVAGITAAEYFQAGSGAELKKVYDSLNARYVLETQPTEITALLCLAAALLALMAAGLSLAWFGRVV
jgi:Ca-activated chloride channel family protein